mmetsp:Transcript_16491/g.28004  ORF Transcript_16491/g.28004 Transcript_16491/m.28004 type:complete len:121 (-) Transcript_16491:82-444(-)
MSAKVDYVNFQVSQHRQTLQQLHKLESEVSKEVEAVVDLHWQIQDTQDKYKRLKQMVTPPPTASAKKAAARPSMKPYRSRHGQVAGSQCESCQTGVWCKTHSLRRGSKLVQVKGRFPRVK